MRRVIAIVFGTNKFHQYIYGKQVSVETDHKPLESLFKETLSKAPQRIQRMMLRFQHYDLKVNYVLGNQLLIVDTLSRASHSQSTLSTEEFEVHLLIQISNRAPVAQLVEHRAATRDVVSSTPAGPTLRVFK